MAPFTMKEKNEQKWLWGGPITSSDCSVLKLRGLLNIQENVEYIITKYMILGLGLAELGLEIQIFFEVEQVLFLLYPIFNN